MTVQTTQFRQEFVGNDVTVDFPLSFPFIDRAHLVATRVPSSGGAPEVLSIVDSTGDSLNGGWGITLSAPVGTGYVLWVERVTPVLQPRPWTPNDKFPAKAHEGAHDRAIMIIQELAGRLSLGQLSTDPATFIEGLELVVGPALQPGQIGYATDSKALLLKLQDGSIVRIPVESGEGGTASVRVQTGFEEGETGAVLPAYEMAEIAAINLPAGFFNTHKILDIDIPIQVTTGSPTGALQFIGYVGADSIFGTLSTGRVNVKDPIKVRFFAQENGILFGHCDASQQEDPVNMSTTYRSVDFSAPISISIKAMHLGAGDLTADIGPRIWETIEEIQTGGGAGNSQLIGTAGGDLSGIYPAPSVVGLRGKTLPALPSRRAILTWNGMAWELSEADPRPIVEVESFNYASGKLVRDSLEEIWSDTDANGCFCWITPCEGWESIKYARTTFCAKVFGWEPKFAIWGWTGFMSDPWVLLKDGVWSSINGLSARESVDIDIATPGYKWVKMATDPGPLIAPEWVMETGFVYPPAVQAAPFPNAAGFVGARASWLDPFGTEFPEIIADDPKYLVTKWMALGVQISAS